MVTYLEGVTPGQPPFAFHEEVAVSKGELKNLFKDVTTTYGNLLVNQTVLVYPFGSKIEYMESRIDVPRIERIIEARLQDDPAPGQTPQVETIPAPIYVSEYHRYNEAMFSLAGFTQLCVASATARTMTTDPRIAERRSQLLEENKDRLHDPVVQAKIDRELIAMDKEWLKGDPGEGFYLKDASYSVKRKKMFLLQGSEEGFDIQGDLIPSSLDEGWDIRFLPAMGNSLREGSYKRGAMTALGGEATKLILRIFQNTSITEEDCGSTLGLLTVIQPEDAKYYVSNSVITAAGTIELTEENIGKYVGKPIRIRSPIYCRTKAANFCACCIGKKIGQTPNAITTYGADITATFMNIEMKSMHGKGLSVATFDFNAALN